MFEALDRATLAEMGDEALISAVTVATRDEAAMAARRLALVAEVTARQCDDEDDVIAHQVIDGWAFAKAQVSAACKLGPMAASKQMRIAQALRDRLPRTAALFATGAVSATIIDAITWRTRLVTDDEALALIDTALAGSAAGFGTLSEAGLVAAVDLWVEKFDPSAVIRSKVAAKDLYVEFDDKDDPNGVCSFWGRLRVTDKKILEKRLDDLAATVCPNDPRRIGERRADALAALGVVGPELERLICQCGAADCPGSGKDPRSTAVTIYVLTDQIPESAPPPAAKFFTKPNKTAAPAPGAGSGVLLDGGIVPAPMLAELVATGAKVRPLAEIAEHPAEPRHDPSTKLTAFVRVRSMTCSFPGCGRPAHRCDLDHLIPWPAGVTHPGNLHPLCREHHLLKTFRAGPGGWTATAKPDGTIEWTAPTGHTYVKSPGAAILFPQWNINTVIPPPGPITAVAGTNRDAMMPTRRRTRAQDRAQRIKAERDRNAAELAGGGSDPPPF